MGSCASKQIDIIECESDESEDIKDRTIVFPGLEPNTNGEDEGDNFSVNSTSSNISDVMNGVSNVVYRKEYIQNVYAMTSEELGTGVTGSVRVVIDRETGERYALKAINLLGLSAAQKERLVTESVILARLHHQNIVKLYEIYESESAIYLVMELLSGGELFDRLMAQPEHKFDEEYACHIVKDILNAITYLHNYKNIAHRDLKLSNIMFSDTSPNAELKLIDFGLSKLLDTTEYTHTLVGTRNYIAPEIYMKEYQGTGYNKSCDMWSIGIITYFLLTGRNPLHGQVEDARLQELKKTKIQYPRRFWSNISSEAKSFVECLLRYDPATRMTAVQAQEHPWFKKQCPPIYSELSPAILESMQTFQTYNRLRKAAMTAVAYHLSSKELQQLEKAFEFFDHTNSGTITMSEFRQAINMLSQTASMKRKNGASMTDTDSSQQALPSVGSSVHSSPDELSLPSVVAGSHSDNLVMTESSQTEIMCGRDWKSEQVHEDELYQNITELSSNEKMLIDLFNGIDFNKTGYIDYSEFLAACLSRKEGLKREYAELIFDLIDRDHKGVIEVVDLHLFFGGNISIEEIESIIVSTFGEKKDVLTESDLEKIMRTNMINNEKTVEVVEQENIANSRHITTKAVINCYFDEIKITQETPRNDISSKEKPRDLIPSDMRVLHCKSVVDTDDMEAFHFDDQAKRRFTSFRTIQSNKQSSPTGQF